MFIKRTIALRLFFFYAIVILAFVIAIAYMLFYKLGEGYLIQTDEAYHVTNAYEMFKQGNWLVNTYRYAADYFNSKPPLCLDMMVLSYKVFGVSGFAARFPSAHVQGCLLFTCTELPRWIRYIICFLLWRCCHCI